MKQKPIKTIYPEFTGEPETWINPARPFIDEALVKELEAIARQPDGSPRYIVEWMPDCRTYYEDVPEYNENGLCIGVERGGFFHDAQAQLCIFDVATAYRYEDERGRTRLLKPGDKDTAPQNAILKPVIETVSIAKPRWRVREYLDSETSPIFGAGDYFTVWTCEVLEQTGETDEEIEVTSTYRAFSRYDVNQAQNLYNERQKLTKSDKIRALEIQAAEALKIKAENQRQTDEENRAIAEKFFFDEQYKKTPGVQIYAK